jgi:hypothetical protein
MYPSDDRCIRTRLLIRQTQEARERMLVRVAESQALRARATGLCDRAIAATEAAQRHSKSRGEVDR